MTLSIQLLKIPGKEVMLQREFFLDGNQIIVGRNYTADVCLPDKSGVISSTHVVFTLQEEGKYNVQNISPNGTILNNHKLKLGETSSIFDGNILEIGDYQLLISIVGGIQHTFQTKSEQKLVFEYQSDFFSEEVLIPNESVEDIRELNKTEFSKVDMGLDKGLMFDPFSSEVELNEDTVKQPVEYRQLHHDPQQQPADVISLGNSEYQVATRSDSNLSSLLETMGNAFDQFLDQIDPKELQSEYDDYTTLFSNKQKRYWKIHTSQFSKKRKNGEFRRNFIALFVEKMQKR